MHAVTVSCEARREMFQLSLPSAQTDFKLPKQMCSLHYNLKLRRHALAVFVAPRLFYALRTAVILVHFKLAHDESKQPTYTI